MQFRRRRTRPLSAVLSAPIGCGIDVVELNRFQKAARRGGSAFMRRVFTKKEEAYAKARKRTLWLHLAGRFAAKEAVIKAIAQVYPKRRLSMNQVEICNDRLGRPSIVLHDGRKPSLAIAISLSHVASVAVANAIVIKNS